VNAPQQPLRVLVLDDEPPARRRLVRLLSAHPTTRVVAEAGSVAEARARLADSQPDLAFVDVQLRGEDAFSLFDGAPVLAAIVFVTAHAEHAVRAFECDVVDYLLKPIRPERLAAALGRVERWRASRAGNDALEQPRQSALVRTHRGELRLISCHDILHIVARDDHTELFLRDGNSYLDATRMDAWERRLPPSFLRTHRSYIANLEAAEGLSRRSHGWVLLLPSASVPVSRSRLVQVRATLHASAR
jgi:DNA-binding LytR/AlgR family response regulator